MRGKENERQRTVKYKMMMIWNSDTKNNNLYNIYVRLKVINQQTINSDYNVSVHLVQESIKISVH